MCVFVQGLPTDCGDGSARGVSSQASSGTVWPERGNGNDSDTMSLFTAIDKKHISEMVRDYLA